MLRSELPLENGDKAKFGLTNKSYIPLKINALSLELRGFLIRIYEGDAAQGEVKLEKQLLAFASNPVVDIPVAFQSGTSENGRFTMAISSLFSEADRKKYGEPPIQILHGVRNTSKPVIDKSTLTLSSSSDVSNVISGLAENTFIVKYPRCVDGYSIAARLGISSIDISKLVFAPCANKQATLTTQSVVPASASQLGGTDMLHFFIKDNFGNISDDSKDSLNALSVYIDFGKPDLATQGIGVNSRIGFVAAGTPKGTQAAPTLFGKSADGLSTETLQIAATQSGSIVLRFNYIENCKHDAPSTADGISDPLGQKIAKFVMAKSSAAAEALDATSFISCGEDQTLTAADFEFPSDSALPASFYLRIVDAAGNASAPHLFTIPACAGITLNDGNNKVCWKP